MSSIPYCIGVRYRVARPLGQGGMAQVFQCWDLQLHRWCAVKLMSEALTTRPVLRGRFSSEARTLAQLAHRHVVQIFDLVDDVPHPYLVTEYLEGGSAEQLPHPLHPHHAAILCAQVASALGAAHRAGVIHRDVKPANILLERSGLAKLGDFGIAMLLGERRQGVAGTLEFMAPEQASGQASPMSDVYALGATLFALLSPQTPEALRGPERVALLERMPGPLRPLLLRATQPSPADRCTAPELAALLERAAQELTSRDLGPLPLALRPPVEQPTERSCPPELADLLAGTRLDQDKVTLVHEPLAGPVLTAEPELGRRMLKVEVAHEHSERLLEAARVLDRVRDPAIPQVLCAGTAPGGRRWVGLRHEPAGELLEAYAERLTPSRRAAWLLPLARQASRIVAVGHAQRVAHGALQDAHCKIWVNGGEISLVQSWGGRELADLLDQGPDHFLDDVRDIAQLYVWCGGLPPRLQRVVQRALDGAYPDLVAFERARAEAERERPSLWGRVGAAGALLAAVGLAGLLGLAAGARREPVLVPVPQLAYAPAPTPQDHLERLLQAGARLEERSKEVCPSEDMVWKALNPASQILGYSYGTPQLATGTEAQGVFAAEPWVVKYLSRKAADPQSKGPQVTDAKLNSLGTVAHPTLLAANRQWVAVARRDGGVSVISQEEPWRTELPGGTFVDCLRIGDDEIEVGRADGSMERWRLRPGVRLVTYPFERKVQAEGPLLQGRHDPALSWKLEDERLVRTENGVAQTVADGVLAFGAFDRSVAAATEDGRLLLWTEGGSVSLDLPSPLVALRLVQNPPQLTLELTDHVLEIDPCVIELAQGDPSCARELSPEVRLGAWTQWSR